MTDDEIMNMTDDELDAYLDSQGISKAGMEVTVKEMFTKLYWEVRLLIESGNPYHPLALELIRQYEAKYGKGVN